MAKSTGKRAPDTNEVEVSVFGPGRGEAIAVHVGSGQWLTVDSCMDQTTGSHVLLDYFDEIGVDPSHQVRLVVGTHAHDDHIAGISTLYAAAKDAQFVTSSALTSSEFFSALEADLDIDEQLRQSVRREYRAIFDEVERRGLLPDGRTPIIHAVEQRVIWNGAKSGLPGTMVTALSPSDRAVSRALSNLAQGTAKVADRKRLTVGDPNEYAIALWVDMGGTSALLGADLIIGPEGCGWKAVLNTHAVTDKATLFKVPHHGSPNADHPRVWSDLLAPDVISLVAPFRAGRVTRPDPVDARRISDNSAAAYLTAPSKIPAQGRATKKASTTLQGLATNIREPYGTVGHIRARRSTAVTNWTVELFPPAHQLAFS